ncbi:FecR family protein [Flagellimonas myxillae]|uniref:FecR family protein n=1 Tax=Flagellimonas myxillae TaxID=2942214 RepID=UPI00201EB877|nr:FecR domain-containing protein [Muricauda myxillae]MCL6265423.1 DUF4974 domain-containing protein [Muricauda myxillae]
MEQKIKYIIKDYLENKISAKDLKILQEWVSVPENKKMFKEHLAEHYKSPLFDVDKAYDVFERRTGQDKNTKSKVIRIQPYLRYAAMLIITISMGYLVYHLNQQPTADLPINEVTLETDGGTYILDVSGQRSITSKNNEEVVATQNGETLSYNGNLESGEIVYNILNVPYGRTFEVELSDKTYVYLNAGSRLKYPAHFAPNVPREVFLEGEAYFKVTKNDESPFIVRANGASTEVFGTEFNVTSYSEDNETSIVLVEGSIGVFEEETRFDPEKHTKLVPNQMASISGKAPITITQVDVSGYIAWVDGQLIFKNEKFENIARKLQRHYNVIITNNNLALNEKRFTGRFDIETVEQILNTFQRTNPFNYRISNRQIIINP